MEHIQEMVSALARLKYYCKDDDNELQMICKLMEQYIETKCQHHIIYDVIDISPDASQTIRYCEYCEKTFP